MDGWNHNKQHHTFLLDQVPEKGISALDIGCGTGEFASKLAARCRYVDAIDTDPLAIKTSRYRYQSIRNLDFHHASFSEFPHETKRYDFISVIAALHHMDPFKATERMVRLLRPNGVLAILGLYKEETYLDFLWSLASVPVDRYYRFLHQQSEMDSGHQMVVQEPDMGIGDIRALMHKTAPNHRFRRHLLWRYSIIWKKS